MREFIESLNLLGGWLVDNLWQLSIELLILSIVVAIVIFVFRIKSPAVRHLFCCLILLKPVATILIASPVSLYWFLHPVKKAEVIAPPVPIVRMEKAASVSSMPVKMLGTIRRPSVNIAVPAAEPSAWTRFNRYGTFASAWLLIAFILTGRFLAGFVYVWLIRKRSIIQLEGDLYNILKDVNNDLSAFPKPRIALCKGDCGPVLAGIISPLILMPEKLTNLLSTEQLRLIVAHELTHVRRMDNLVLVLQRLAEIFLFFHPVVWICGKIMRNDAEAACDNAVIAAYDNPKDYAESLLCVAEAREKLCRKLLVNTFAAAESDFSRRLKNIIRNKPARMTLGFSTLIFTILTIIGCLGLPGSTERKKENNNIKQQTGESSENMKKAAKEEKCPNIKREGIELKHANVQSFNDNKSEVLTEKKLIDLPAPSEERGNTYARGMSTVLSYLGKNISYDQVMGLTGVAFILQLDTSGPFINGELDCAWWPNDAWGFNLGLPVLSKACGWDFRQLRCDNKAYQADVVAAYQKSIAPELAKSLKAGRPVLAEYDHCFIVTGADNGNPPLLGYGTLGARFKDVLCTPYYPRAAIVFDKKITPEKQAKIDIASLRHIIALFDEQAQENASGSRFSGKQAWEEWIKLLKKGSACDNNMLIHLRYNRSCAVAYLKEMAEHYSGKTAEHIDAAAKLYKQALAKLMKQGLPWNLVKDGRPEQEVRAEYTEMVESVFKLETKAIDHLCKALKSEGVDVKKLKKASKSLALSDGKKIIENVSPISWAKTGDCSYAAALEAALKVTTHPYSYSDIMGYSVLAFRTRWRGLKSKKSEPWWCGSIPVGEFEEEVNRTSEITGWNIFATGMFDSEPEKLKEYIPKVVDSINKGFPVVAYPTMKNLNCGVIYGYQVKNGKLKFYWRDLFKGNEEYLQDADETGPLLFFLESWKKPVSAKERFLSSLVQAVYNWSRAPLGTPSYYTWSYGKEAFEIWTNDLRNGSKYSENLLKEFFFVNAWNYSTLRDARKHAVKFLEENKDQLPKKEQKNLEEAIDLYKREVKLLVGSSDLFKGPMNKKELKDWTQSECDKAAEVLTKLSVLENQAMDIFGEILKSENKKSSD